MKKKYLNLRILLCLFFFLINAFSQDYVSDTLAVRAILDSNGLDTVPVESLIDSSNGRIYFLSLHSKNLSYLPSELGNLTALEYLYLSVNKLTNLPPEIGNLNNLLWIELSVNNIESLPKEILNLTNLVCIWFNGNNLSHIPSEIFNIVSLQYLFINQNNLTSLPSEIEKLTNLKVLDIKENNLTILPNEIGNLSNLKNLYLQHNNLTTLPDSIVKLTPIGDSDMVDGLDLSYNKLDTNTLSDTIKSWADKWDRDWRKIQNVPIIYNPNIKSLEFSINLKNSSILFNLPTSANTKLQIYNMKGRLLSTFVDSYKQAGEYKVNLDSNRFGSGIYFIKLSANGSAVSKKFTIIK